MKRVSLRISLCLCLAVLSCAGARAQRRQSPVALVPRNGVAIIKVDWAAVSRDERLRALVKGNEFEKMLGSLGISSGELSEFVVFSGFNVSQNGTAGMILSGQYRAQNIVGQVKERGWAEHQYKSYKVYSNPADNSWMAPLRSGMIVAGSRSGVEMVIDVEMSPRTGAAFKPPFSSALARFTASRHPISFVMGLPAEYQDAADVALTVVSTLISFPGSGPLGMVMGKIGLPRMLGFSITRDGGSFPVELLAMMKDSTSAGIISGTLNMAQGLGLSLLADRMPKSDRDVLKNISVTRDGALLSIKMALRESDLPR